MVSQTIKVVYENGVFRPLTPPEPALEEGDQASLQLSTKEESNLSPQEITKLATSVLEGLTDEEISEMEKIALDRSHFSSSCPI